MYSSSSSEEPDILRDASLKVAVLVVEGEMQDQNLEVVDGGVWS